MRSLNDEADGWLGELNGDHWELDETGETALVIEPAQPSEIAPIIAEAYELSCREREITEHYAAIHTDPANIVRT